MYAIVAQLVEQMLCKHPVVGSNPIDGSMYRVRSISLKIGPVYAGIAQLVEHLVANQKVAGSNPVSRSIK